MPDEDLTNYTIRTLMTIPRTENVEKGDWIPWSMAPNWDGKFLTVYGKLHTSATNSVDRSCIYDVESATFLNLPGHFKGAVFE